LNLRERLRTELELRVASDSVHERASFIRRADYVRAYAFLVGQARAEEIVAEMFERLHADDSAQSVLDPEFIALLALFSAEGKTLAKTKMSDAELLGRQRTLCRAYASIREEFPHVLMRENGNSA